MGANSSSSNSSSSWTANDLESISNETLLWKLLSTHPDFVSNVPHHWLAQEPPSRLAEYLLLVVYLVLCVPANIAQLLVIITFFRLVITPKRFFF